MEEIGMLHSARQDLRLTSRIRLPSGHGMPVLGLGTYQNYNTKETCLEAFKIGYRHIDSAQAYKSEAHVGAAFRESGLNRNDVFITTKCVSRTHGYESTLQGVDASLDRLGLDYIDLFLIHDPLSGSEKRLATYRALLQARRAGKIRDVGVSNYGIKHLEEIKSAGLDMPAVNQIQLHPYLQQRPIVEYCNTHSIIVQAYSPLLRGQLNDPIFQSLAHKHNCDVGQILIRWSLQKGFVPLPKSAHQTRIASNADVFGFWLMDSEVAELDGLDCGKEVTWNPVNAP